MLPPAIRHERHVVFRPFKRERECVEKCERLACWCLLLMLLRVNFMCLSLLQI